jgi:hypothetical protein
MIRSMLARASRATAQRSRTALVVVALAFAGLYATACDVHGLSAPGTLQTIVVSPNPQNLVVNATQQFTAVGADFDGADVPLTPVWSIVSGGGSISPSGMFTAGTVPGTYTSTVKATSGGKSGVATVTVVVGALASITVTPNPNTLDQGGTQQYVAVGKDAAGNVVSFAPTWSVIADGGSISNSGLFTAGTAAGTFANTIQASSLGIVGTATVTVRSGPLATIHVTPNPATMQVSTGQQFTAVGNDASGNLVAVAPTWTVEAGGGTIDGNGLFTAGGTPGTFANTVKATSGGISGTATVTVTSGALATITIVPNPATLLSGGKQQFGAIARDANGNVMAISPIWLVVNGGGTINSSSGLFTAGSTAGTFTNTIKATSGSISGFATVVVTTSPVATVTVTPNPAHMLVNTTQQFAAVARDGSSNVLPASTTWAVVAGGGTIDAGTGLFTAGSVSGTFTNTVRATSGGISGFATVVITAAVPPVPFIDLGSAAADGILAGTAVSCTGSASTINANVAIWPGNTISGPCIVTGTQHLGDPQALADQSALTAAYNTAAGKPCSASNVISGDLGGTTKLPGVYCASSLSLTGVLTLDGNGDPNATFLFQSGSSLITAGNVVLINGAQAKNVFWQVGSSATLGTGSQFQGNILALTSITLVTGTQLNGRALARNGAVSAGTGSVITLP